MYAKLSPSLDVRDPSVPSCFVSSAPLSEVKASFPIVDSFDVSSMSTGEAQNSCSTSAALLVLMLAVRAREQSRPRRIDIRCLISALDMLISSSVRQASGEKLASGCGREVVLPLKYSSGKPVFHSRSEEGLCGSMVSDDDQPWADDL